MSVDHSVADAVAGVGIDPEAEIVEALAQHWPRLEQAFPAGRLDEARELHEEGRELTSAMIGWITRADAFYNEVYDEIQTRFEPESPSGYTIALYRLLGVDGILEWRSMLRDAVEDRDLDWADVEQLLDWPSK